MIFTRVSALSFMYHLLSLNFAQQGVLAHPLLPFYFHISVRFYYYTHWYINYLCDLCVLGDYTFPIILSIPTKHKNNREIYIPKSPIPAKHNLPGPLEVNAQGVCLLSNRTQRRATDFPVAFSCCCPQITPNPHPRQNNSL